MSEFPDCYHMVIRKARKSHECCECHGIICKGEKYHYHSGIWDGVPNSFKVCFECDELRDYMDRDVLYPEERTGLGDIAWNMGNCDNYNELHAKLMNIQQKRGKFALITPK